MEQRDYTARRIDVALHIIGENMDVLNKLNERRPLLSVWKIMDLELYLTFYTEMNSKYIKCLNVQGKRMKLFRREDR